MRAIKLNEEDNVAVVAQDTPCGEILEVDGGSVVPVQDIPAGHKVAIRDIAAGAFIVKYGVPIGRARVGIKMGEHVHVHNVEDVTEQLCREYRDRYLRESEAIQP